MPDRDRIGPAGRDGRPTRHGGQAWNEHAKHAIAYIGYAEERDPPPLPPLGSVEECGDGIGLILL